MKMKDSGIEWIGEIPETWEVVKGKYLFTQRSSKGNGLNLTLLSPTQKYGVIPQSMYEELTGMKPVKISQQKELNLFKTIYKGDFCISLRSFEGGFEYSDYEGVVSPAYQVFCRSDNNLIDTYYKYLFKDKTFIDKMNSYTMSLRDGKNIAFNDFGNTYIPVPPKSEQQRIADFLDRKTAKIDRLIDKMNTQIDTLRSYQSSVITQAVTKGLDPRVPMKDSGVEWIGEIPETWEVASNKFVMTKIKQIIPKYTGEPILSLSMSGVLERNLDDGGKMPATFNGYQIVKSGNLLLCLFDIDVTPRCVGYIQTDGITSPAYSQYKVNDNNSAKYYYYYYLMIDNNKVLVHLTKSLRNTIKTDQFDNIKAIVPSKSEQHQIADFLDEKVSQIQHLIAAKQQQIKRLRDYKNALVFEYVTGKKQVNEVE